MKRCRIRCVDNFSSPSPSTQRQHYDTRDFNPKRVGYITLARLLAAIVSPNSCFEHNYFHLFLFRNSIFVNHRRTAHGAGEGGGGAAAPLEFLNFSHFRAKKSGNIRAKTT